MDLSNNTAIALNQYVNLLKKSTEASVHCTELQLILESNGKLDSTAQFQKLLYTRMIPNLYKDGIDGIHKYRDDYEKANMLFLTAKQHVANASANSVKDLKASCIELDYANKALDEIVILSKRKIQELTEGMLEAYKVLKY